MSTYYYDKKHKVELWFKDEIDIKEIPKYISEYYKDQSVYKYGKFCSLLHRDDGPAIIDEHGSTWILNGRRHRIDGPSDVWTSGDFTFSLENVQYDFSDWIIRTPISIEEKVALKLQYGVIDEESL